MTSSSEKSTTGTPERSKANQGLTLSLRTKLIASVSALLIVISVFLMAFFPSRMAEVSLRGLENKAKGMSTVLASAAAPAVEFNEASPIEEIFRQMGKAEDVAYVGLWGGNGSLLASVNPTILPKDVVDKPSLEPQIENGYLRHDTLIKPKVGAPGRLIIGFKLDGLERERDEQIRTVLVVSILVLLSGLGISFWIGTFLLRPIQELTRVTREITRTGDFNQEIVINTRDEVGTLAVTFREMMEKLKVVPLTVGKLAIAVTDLTQLINDHTESTQQQSSGLAEATVTMQEIRQTSNTAASKAETVIAVAKKAEEFSVAGQEAVESSIKSLQEIRTQIEQIVAKIADLSERTLQVGGIIETVKDLADQSNMLALNASIEAVKAGELGKGFGVVAREIRSLADQSIQATGRIREVLTEIQRAIRSTASMTEQGKKDMERSMDQIRVSGESLREMNAVVSESSQAARQIAASVNQQNVGIAQITVAIEGLNAAMEKTASGIGRAEQAAANLSSLSAQISGVLAGSTSG